MQKRKLAALAGVTLLSAGFLAACGSAASNGDSSAPTTYSYVFTSDPTTLDYTVRNAAETTDITTNLVDGLLENDKYGNLIPSLAESWTVSADGLTYTYKLREGVMWYTSDGEEYAEVTAQDFVTGLQHAADSESEALYLVQDSIKGLAAYLDGSDKDFANVGVKAVDDYTVEYTLAQAEPYWNSKTTMGILQPINAEFLESKGEDFGSVDPTSILYNGAYFLSAFTSKSSIEFTKNENYWDAENVNIDEVKLTFYDGQDPESLINGYMDGNYTVARVFPNSSSYASVKEQFGDNIIYSMQDATTYYAAVNVDRTLYDHTSKTTDAEKSSTKAALLNKDFRQALSFAINRETYSAQSNGEEGGAKAVRNTLTPTNFVSIGEKTFGDVVEEQIVQYGEEWADVDLSDGQDGIYDAEKAKAQLETAKTALSAEGVTFPIHIDIPVNQTSEINVQQAQSLKQSVEDALGTDNVVIDLQMLDRDTYLNATYYATTPEQADFDISISAGWGPDYSDPSTYLDIMSAETGATVHYIGVAAGEDAELAKQVGLDEYQAILGEASAETSDMEKRYTLYAQAQAWLTDSALIIPTISLGASPSVGNVVPFSGAYSAVGIKGGANTYFKYMELQDEPVTVEQYDEAKATWEEERAKSNAEAQADLANHVEE